MKWAGKDNKQGDEIQQRFLQMELVRESTGEALPWDPALNAKFDQYDRLKGEFGTNGVFSTPLQVGEYVYLRIPQAFRPVAGMADWNYEAFGTETYNSWHMYNPSPNMSYREINRIGRQAG